MTVSLKHLFVSAVADGADNDVVQPSDWNDEHVLTMATSRILGRVTASTGAVEELTASQVKTLLAIAAGDVSGLGSLATASSVTVSQISDASANGRSLISAADYAAIRALLDVESGTDFLSPAAIAAAYQPLDSDLTAIAALTTTAYGRGLLELASEAALEDTIDTLANLTSIQGVSFTFGSYASTLLNTTSEGAFKAAVNLEIGTDVQAYDADLTTWAGLTPSANFQTLVTQTFAQMRASLDLEAGTDFLSPAAIAAAYQPLDADLTSWAAVTRASGFDTFVATPTSANLRTLISDETGTGALYFAGGNAGTPSAINLTNGTALPVSGITSSTSTALGVGTLELGHASDTTLSRASAGRLAVEGVNVVTTSSTDTLTNKTLTAPVLSGAVTNNGTPSGNVGLTLGTSVTNTSDNAFGVYMGGTTLQPASGFSAFFQYVGGGTVSTSNGTVGLAAALYAENITKSGANNITGSYGAYLAAQTGGVVNYSLYSVGAAGFGAAVIFPGVGTTASAANAFLDAGASNNLLRSTSSAAYKASVEDLSLDSARKVLDLRPVWYRSKAPADRKDWSFYGLIAEEVAMIDPRLVHWSYRDEDYEVGTSAGERHVKKGAKKVPDGVQYERLSVLLVTLLKDAMSRIEALEAR